MKMILSGKTLYISSAPYMASFKIDFLLVLLIKMTFTAYNVYGIYSFTVSGL